MSSAISEFCEASQCIHPKKAFNLDDEVCCIQHSHAKHVFHKACYTVELSKSPEFLREGKLIHCPYCEKTVCKETSYPHSREVAKVGFLFHIFDKQFDVVRNILRSGLISDKLQQNAASRFPEVAAILAEEQAAAQPQAPIKLSAASLKLQSVAKTFMSINPSATLREVREYLVSAGHNVSLATLTFLVRR